MELTIGQSLLLFLESAVLIRILDGKKVSIEGSLARSIDNWLWLMDCCSGLGSNTGVRESRCYNT